MYKNLPGYGILPREKISHKRIPYDQTSDSDDIMRLVRDSGAIHFTGISDCISNIFVEGTIVSNTYKRKWLGYLSLFLVITFVVHFARHSEIGHFNDSIVRQQNISGGQVSVKNLKNMKTYVILVVPFLGNKMTLPFC